MKVIGVTGGVGAGKSQVLDYLHEKYGAVICKADEVAKELQQKGTDCYEAMLELFGTEHLDENGEFNREKLAKEVFAKPETLNTLNKIVHPAVKKEILRRIEEEKKAGTELFIIEGAVIIEDHYNAFCDEFWFVYVKKDIRKKRLIYSRGYSEEKIDNIFASQLSKETFLICCDRVIDNNGVFVETMMQLDSIIESLR